MKAVALRLCFDVRCAGAIEVLKATGDPNQRLWYLIGELQKSWDRINLVGVESGR